MSVALCMIVLNGAETIERAVESAVPYCDEFVIVDSGSTDGTPSLLKERFDIDVIHYPYPHSVENGLSQLRAFSFDQIRESDWALVLDADEVIHRFPQELDLGALEEDIAGVFGTWINERNGVAYLDYKMFFLNVRMGVRFHGLVHATPQPSVRELGKRAIMAEGFRVVHEQHFTGYRQHYLEQMMIAAAAFPHYIRYHWFLGYTLLQMGDVSGTFWLALAAHTESKTFPVEQLNAMLTLAEHFLSVNKHYKATEYLMLAKARYEQVLDDFEVKINCYVSWIQSVESALSGGAYERRNFAC